MSATPAVTPDRRQPEYVCLAGRGVAPGVLGLVTLAGIAAALGDEAPPWKQGLADARPWAAVVSASMASSGGALDTAGLAGWLEAVEGGLKLRAPWPADAMLRLRLPTSATGEIVFWNGEHGAAFRFAGAAGWSSYRVARTQAATGGDLWETDDGLFWKFHAVDIEWRKFRGKIRDTRTVRDNATPLDFFWSGGDMQLWRGEVRLASAPLLEPPRDVVLRFPQPPTGLEMVRLAEPPARPRHQPVAAVDSVRPGELEWTITAAPPASATRPDGRLVLTAPEAAGVAKATLPITLAGVNDVVFVVERATNGTGVFLGGGDAAPLGGVQVVQADGDSLAVSLANPWENPPPPADREPLGRPLWIRVLPASGMLRCWQSHDGRHWALVGSKPMPTETPVATCGLIAAAGTPRHRSITLRRLQIRDYSGFNTLAPAEVRGRVPVAISPTVDAWRQWMTQTRPADVPLPVWQRAAAVRSLGCGPPRPVANWLLRRLLEEAPRVPRPVDDNRRLLAEFPDLAAMAWVAPWDGRPDEPITADLAAAAAALAEVAQLDGEPRSYSLLGTEAAAARLGPYPQLNYDFPDATVLPELMQAVAAGRADEAESTARRVQCFGRDGSAAATQWGIDAAAAMRRGEPVAPAPFPGGWPARPMEANKSQSLYLADLTAAAAAGNSARVAQLLADLEPNAPAELFADPRDPRVGQTAAAAVARLLAEAPAVAAGLKPAPAGKLRVRIAINAGNAAGVLHAASQFAGTPAAAEAALWIGDQLLARGAAPAAIGWYEKGEATADLVQKQTLGARLMAAKAAAAGGPPPVEIVVPGPAAMRVGPLPDPAPGRPWTGRSLAIAAIGDRIVAQDDRSLAMLAGGQVAWQASCDGGAVAEPTFTGEFTIAASGPGLRLHRFAAADGQPRGGPVVIDGAVPVLSTPFVTGAAATAFVQAAGTPPMLALSAAAFDGKGPTPPMASLPWSGPGGCPPLAVDDVLLAFVEGGIAGCEAIGPLRWFRRQDSISAEAQAAAGPPLATRSFAIGKDAIVWQPRVPYVERIAAASGRRVWARPLPRIRRLLGIVADRVIVEAGRRLVAIDVGDGRITWSVAVGELLSPAAVGRPGGILVSRRSAEAACPELLWVDPATGGLLGAARLDPLAGEGWTFGPWAVGGGRIAVFFQDASGAVRLSELTPAGVVGPGNPFVEGGSW